MRLRPSMISRRRWRTAARWTAALAVLAVLVASLDGGLIVERIRAANGLWVTAGVAGLVAVHAIAAAAWRTLCRRLGSLRLSWATCLRTYYAAQALGGLTPANLGGDAYRVMTVRGAGLGWNAAVAPVMVQRATSYLALAVMALPALAWLSISSSVPAAILAAGLMLCALAGGVAVLLLMAPDWLVRARSRLSRATVGEGGGPGTTVGVPRSPVGGVTVATGFGLAFHGASVLLTALLVFAVDSSAAGISVVAAITVARLSLAVPVLPSGLGVNEAALSVLFIGIGVAPQVALAALLLTRLALVLTTALGAALFLVNRRGMAPAEGPARRRSVSAPPI